MNISKDTLDILNNMYSYHFNDANCNMVTDINLATEIYIGCEKLNGAIIDADGFFINAIFKTIKATKKEMTIDYIMNKINTDKVYSNFSKEFNKIISKFGLGAYPTTYGIGVFVAIGFRESINSIKNEVEKALKGIGVKYLTEYSEAGWVFRYKISKSKENIEVINKFLSVK